MTRETWGRLSGQPVYDSKGQKIGDVRRVFFDEATSEPAWVTVGSAKRDRESVIPLSGAKINPTGLAVAIRGSQIKDAPSIDIESDLTADDVAQVNRHYESSDSGGGGKGSDQDRAELTRFEEQVDVGTETFESGHAHLHKSVTTEPVDETVTLKHEKARVEHVPADGRPTSHEFAEEDAEITLHDQRPTKSKKTVPVETVRVAAESSDEQRHVSDEVRKERIDVDEDEDASTSGRRR